MIWGILSKDTPAFRARLIPFLEGFAERSHSRWSLPDICEEIAAAKVQVWICGNWQAVALTRVWPDAVSIVACSGEEREDWCNELEQTIRAWAKSLGKRNLLIDGRPGWSRWLKTLGYQEAHREMVVTIE